MTHVSQKRVGAIDYQQAEVQLVQLIAKLGTSGATHFIHELFTEAERIMIIKRFAAIFMFQQKYSPYKVSHAIGISLSTSQVYYKGYIEGQFDRLLGSIPKKQKSEFLSLVEDFMLSRVSYKARRRLIKKVIT